MHRPHSKSQHISQTETKRESISTISQIPSVWRRSSRKRTQYSMNSKFKRDFSKPYRKRERVVFRAELFLNSSLARKIEKDPNLHRFPFIHVRLSRSM